MGACAHHYFGDDVKHLVVTSAAAGGAMCNLFDILESLENITEILMIVQSVGNIEIADLFTVADYIVFLHGIYPFAGRNFLLDRFKIRRLRKESVNLNLKIDQ